MVTRIMDDTPSAKWNASRTDRYEKIHPNALIWRVNDVTSDAKNMLQELQNSRETLHLELTNPPNVMFPKQRRARAADRENITPDMPSTWKLRQTADPSGYLPRLARTDLQPMPT